MLRKLLFFVIIYSLAITNCFAQSNSINKPRTNFSNSSEFIFESYPNEPLIPIRLLGAVKNAGLYHIPKNMSLTTLLSLAGGTNPEANLEKIVIGNDQSRIESNVILNLEDMIQHGKNEDYTLKPNDIVLVKNKEPLISNDSFRMISIVSIILTSVLTGVLIKDRIDDK